MTRGTMRVIRNSEVRLQQTNKLLDQFRSLSSFRIKRPDDRVIQSLGQP